MLSVVEGDGMAMEGMVRWVRAWWMSVCVRWVAG